ncbi:PDC sensor domain-containing protein [Maritalea mediterranea]|uniref:PDC sensor domain-containing protein n=1 Tax=Maritalea mediterranea TaxID=2909667 RepID=A0ABS9EAG9_9HYPH|nr:PDC sensor domain-containing protein [Maritalea mediterranea]MCF4099882.1 PDC sensor domain-containing protein [Maritalea mediterranea]
MAIFAPVPLHAGKHNDLLNEIVAGPIAVAVRQEVVWTAVMAQNEALKGISQQEINALDAQWRAETGENVQPLIESVSSREISRYLRAVQNNSEGVLTEIIVTDENGLNVGMSAVSSDYWQGDEEKWRIPYKTGRIHINEIDFDESTQLYQTQISVPVRKRDGTIIGAATFGVHVSPWE